MLVGHVGASHVDPPVIKTRPLFKTVAAGEDRAVPNPPGIPANVELDES
jgi:hypothetical protein